MQGDGEEQQQQSPRKKLGEKVLVLLEQGPSTFGAMAPEFHSICAFGDTREATLRDLKNAIIDELEDPFFKAPKVQISEKEAERRRTELASHSEGNEVSIVYLTV